MVIGISQVVNYCIRDMYAALIYSQSKGEFLALSSGISVLTGKWCNPGWNLAGTGQIVRASISVAEVKISNTH